MFIQSSRFLIIVVICNYFIVTANLKHTIFIQFLVSHKKIRSDIIYFFLNSCAMYWSSNTILIMCNCWNWIGFKYLYISYKIYVDINISHFFLCAFQIYAGYILCTFLQCVIWGSFVVFLILPTTMSGIENISQNCFLSSLMQCMSVNESLFNALVIHSRNHVPDPSKYY